MEGKKYKIAVGEPHEKRPLVESRHRYEYDIKMNPIKICCKLCIGLNWSRTWFYGCCCNDGDEYSSASE
jgi:hypothetical protein